MKGYIFYCQLDYPDRPYPCTTTGFGTIANNGDACELAIACGAREKPGTDLYIFAPVFAEKVGLRLTVTEDAEMVHSFLRDKRGMVIANTRGDREGYTGVFSDSGHYIVLTDLEGDNVRVLDPMYRPGRFDILGRKGKVTMEGNEAVASFSIIPEDCKNRPFFLFEKPAD